MPEEKIIDGGPEVTFFESVPEDAQATPQALHFRVGPVFQGVVEMSKPGVWVQYQEGYLLTPLTGPVLMSIESWRQLNRAMEERFAEWGC